MAPISLGNIKGPQGVSVSSIVRTSGTGSPGTTDTYTITYSDATTSTFDVVNGADGEVSQAILDAALALKAPVDSPTFTGTVSGVTATMVGLGNVDNTSDVNKPISTATQTALNLKAPIASPVFTGNVTLPEITENFASLSSSPAGTLTIDPANGTYQYVTLAEAITTFTVNLDSGQSVTLRIVGGDTYAITWGSITWFSAGGNVAPTMTANDLITIWKEGTTIFAKYLGSAV